MQGSPGFSDKLTLSGLPLNDVSIRKMTLVPKIAFFGGTFDPIHQGHLEIAQKAVEKLGLERVIFFPCRRSPHKPDAPQAKDIDRLEMLKLAIENSPWAEVSDYELKREPPSFTWDTIEYFKRQLGESAALFLIIGFDQWEKLSSWKNIEMLARDLHFIVVGRSQQPMPRKGFKAHFIEGNHPASASEIRKRIRKGLTNQWLPDKVAEYIGEKDLYSPVS